MDLLTDIITALEPWQIASAAVVVAYWLWLYFVGFGVDWDKKDRTLHPRNWEEK